MLDTHSFVNETFICKLCAQRSDDIYISIDNNELVNMI